MLAACCPGLVALPERSEGQGAAWRHLGPWVGGPEQSLLTAALSGHVGAAEGKNCGGGRYQGPRPPGRAGQVPQQACSHRLGQGSCRPTWGGGRLESPVLEVVQVTRGPAGTDLPTSSALPLAEGPGQRGPGWEGGGQQVPLPGVRGCCVWRGVFQRTGQRWEGPGGGAHAVPVLPDPTWHLPTPGFQLRTGGLSAHSLAPGQVLSSLGMRSGWAGPHQPKPRTSLAGPGWALVGEQRGGGS